jgi:hypothetical protein
VRTSLVWRQGPVVEAVAQALERGMHRAMVLVRDDTVRRLSTGQPVRRTASGRLVGLDPSAEGEPPHVLTGRLRLSIKHEVERRGRRILGRVGTNVIYGRRLELGFTGTDAAGRSVRQGPRPYLRPALVENEEAIIRALTSG